MIVGILLAALARGAETDAPDPLGRREPAPTSGITRVEATGNRIALTVTGLESDFEIVQLQPEQGESDIPAATAIARGKGGGSSRLELDRFAVEAGRITDRIDRGFCARVVPGAGKTRVVGAIRHVERCERTARLHPPPVVAKSRKGLQVQMVDDAIALGVQHAAFNVNLSGLVDPHGEPGSIVWENQGRFFHFRRAAVEAIPAKALSDAGAVVTLILLAYASGDPEVDALCLHPGYSPKAPNHLGAFNTKTREGAAWFEAAVGFLADRFSQPGAPHGRASNFIIGNEVTAHWYWANQGEVPAEQFIVDYERTVRLANAAVQAATDSVRVYLSFDHHWNLTYGNNPNRAIAGRRLLDGFNRRAALGGNFDWHVAYHPYPENLGNPRTWLDKTALPSADTPRITFRNLEVLTEYLARPELLWNGRPRRVILSEQGFHSDGTAQGEELQAAAYAYAWEKVARLEGIDAFILHRHVDHGQEGGLNLGLWRRKSGSMADPDMRKPIHDVFRAADTDRREAAFRFALPIVGLTNWQQLAAPGSGGGARP